jgi:hypothetical protein
MFFCCYSGKDPLECGIVSNDNLDDESADKDFTTFKVCPQLFFTQFAKFIYFTHFLSFKKNYFERNSVSSKKTTKQQRIRKEIEVLKSIHMEHIAGQKNNYIL